MLLALLLVARGEANDDTEYVERFRGAWSAFEAGRFEQASDAWRRCLALAPASGTVAYQLASCEARLGRTARALDWLATAAAWGYGDDAVLRFDDDLAALRDEPRWKDVVASMWNAAALSTPLPRPSEWSGDVVGLGVPVVSSDGVRIGVPLDDDTERVFETLHPWRSSVAHSNPMWKRRIGAVPWDQRHMGLLALEGPCLAESISTRSIPTSKCTSARSYADAAPGGAPFAVLDASGRFAVVVHDGELWLFGANGEVTDRLALDGRTRVQCIAYDPVHGRVALAGRDGPVQVLDLASWKPLYAFPNDTLLPTGIYSMSFSPDGEALYLCGSVELIARATADGRPLWNITFDGGNPWGGEIDFALRGERVLLRTFDPREGVFDARTGRELAGDDARAVAACCVPALGGTAILARGRTLRCLDAQTLRLRWERIELPEGAWVLRSPAGYVELSSPPDESSSDTHASTPESTASFEAASLDPKRVRAEIRGVAVRPRSTRRRG